MTAQKSRRAIALVALSVLAGCGGGGGDDGGGDSSRDTISSPPATSDYPTLDPGAASTYRERSEFKAVDLSTSQENSVRSQFGMPPLCSNSGNPDCVSASTYAVQRIHVAHTARLANGDYVRGKGQLIAVVDDGFRTSHREFSGKSIDRYLGDTPALPQLDHGTAVAGIAAARVDGAGIMGVAPDAGLHLSSFWNVTGDLRPHLTGATLDAKDHGAVVQNNSWGWTNEVAAGEELNDYRSSGASSYAEYLASQGRGSAAAWQDLFDAYDSFQQGGVIVFANSNDDELGDSSAWASLPLFVPELEGAWLVASNAFISVDSSSGDIISAELVSAPCGSAAAFCLTSDGTVRAPTAGTDTEYSLMSGTSFAAPQISGEIALLAQAFPNLSPGEWTTRLLATAQSGWQDFEDTVAGQVTFAPGVVRSYSDQYGLGVPDMEAALSPVGGLSIASGASVASSPRTSVDSGLVASAPVVGDAVASALADREIMLLDSLNGDFYVKGSEITRAGSAAAAPVANPARQLSGKAQALSFSFAEAGDTAALTALEETAGAKLFFSQAHQGAEPTARFSEVVALGDKEFLQFSGEIVDAHENDAASFSLSHLARREGFTTEFTLSMGHAANRFFADTSAGPFTGASHTSAFAAGVSVGLPLSEDWSLTGFAELGGAEFGTAENTLVAYKGLAHASAGFAATRRGLFAEDDKLTFYGGVLPTAVAGSASVRLPVSRTADGRIAYDTLDVPLTGGKIPARLGFSYETKLPADFDLNWNANTDFNVAGAGKPQTSLSLGIRKEF